jgi:hypothetical protein
MGQLSFQGAWNPDRARVECVQEGIRTASIHQRERPAAREALGTPQVTGHLPKRSFSSS